MRAMIINRYIFRDLTKTWLSVFTVLLLIATSHKLVRLVSKAATGELSSDLLIQLIGFQLPELIAFLMPLAFFLTILLSFGRYCVDHEFTAFMALGVSWRRLLLLGLSISLVIMCLTGALTLWLVPKLEHQKDNLLAAEEPIVLLQSLSKGRFYSFQDDSLVFYVEELSEDKLSLQEVFIAEQPSSSPSEDEDWTVLTAQKGKIIANDDGQIYVELSDGRRYEGTPGLQDYMMVNFDKYGKLIERKVPKEGLYMYRSMPTQMLMGSSNTSFHAELQWRLAIPLSAPILTLVAMPLSRVPPRKGRFHRFLPGIILFILYYNLLTMCKRWIGQGTLDPSLGMWWVHGIMLLIGLAMVGQVSGFWSGIYYALRGPKHA